VTSVTARLQFAVLLPVAVPPVAFTPLTVTTVIRFRPRRCQLPFPRA
jgi:hypothetical protein